MIDEVIPKWKQLAEAMQREQDPEKVLKLAERLILELAKHDGFLQDAPEKLIFPKRISL